MQADATVLLVGATDRTVRKAKDLGLRVLVLQHPERVTQAPCEPADVVRAVDYTDPTALEAAARELWSTTGFTAVVSLTEPGLEGAGLLNDVFSLGGTGLETARCFRDKLAMRRRLAAAGGTAVTVAAAPLTTRRDLDEFADRHGYPFVVKPRNGTGSYGVFRVTGPEAADRAWAAVGALNGHPMARTTMPFSVDGFLMEEYVDGPQFSAESLSFDGRHVVVGITETHLAVDSFAAFSHAMPARLDGADHARVLDATSLFLDAMGLRDGPAHTEFRLSERGPVVIESHNRFGGGAINELVRGAYAIDLETYALGWPFGLVPELSRPPRARNAAAVRFLVGGPGRVESITGVEDARAEPGVLTAEMWVEPGDTVRPVEDSWDRLGLVAATADTSETAVRLAGRVLRDTIRIQVRGEDGVLRPARLAVPDEAQRRPAHGGSAVPVAAAD
ncbi:ATP-grasp domain-containing protein [Streptomyces sp. NPDC006743]|uniref:ATP-grasp domain-containing protein n=1 Tax=Streptomyces sp. NPDC006743 TaxID=3154480 RepID=UPI0034514200